MWLLIVDDPNNKAADLAAELLRRRPRPMPKGSAVTNGRFQADGTFVQVVGAADYELAKGILMGWEVEFEEREPAATAVDVLRLDT